MKSLFLFLCGSIGLLVLSCASASATDFKFSFGSSDAESGFAHVAAHTTYDAKRGYGFLDEATASDKTSTFAVDVEEGNYDVTIRFGDPSKATSTTIKAESRRLMVEKVETTPGQHVTRTFTINVRRPAIRTGGTTTIDKRESGPPIVPDWDNHLTFEFNGKQPGVESLEIRTAAHAITVFVAGDSTVTDQQREPWAGWAQMLPNFFQQGVAVSNQSWSGLTLSTFESQKRLAKIFSMMNAGDYLFIQFGHNDQKDKYQGAGPFTSYKSNLKRYVEQTRARGGIPILVTPMERRRWQGDQPQPTLREYAEAVRQAGTEEHVPVIDLNSMSLQFYTALGPEGSKQAFVHYPANTFPGQDKALQDDTHHNGYGAYELARCVIQGIKTNVPELATHLDKDIKTFDPAHPDAVDTVVIPLSPAVGATEKPAGS